MAIIQMDEHWSYADQAWETQNGDQFQNNWTNNGNGVYTNQVYAGSTTSSYTTSYTTSKTVDSLITYARVRTINFDAKNLAANADNLQITVDGILMNPKPATGYFVGTDANTVKADNYGEVKGSFDIPANTIKTGARQVVISNPHNKALAVYQADGIRRDITTTTHTETHTVTTPIYDTEVVYDPIAESFKINQDTVITSIDIAFAKKPDGTDTVHRSGITLQVRGIGDQGLPNRTVYEEVTLSPDEVTTSNDASVWTKFTFADPLFVKANDNYCIVLITDTDQYYVYQAKMGEHKLSGYKDIMVSQPYTDGVMFTSSNAQSWSISQDSDLTFRVNSATFNDSGSIVFEPIVFGNEYFTNEDGTPIEDSNGNPIKLTADKIVLLASYLTPDNTGLSWQVRYLTADNNSTTTINDIAWSPISNAVSQDIVGSVTQLQLMATFSSGPSMSPILSLDDLTLGAILTASEGKYITKNQNYTDAPYNALITSYEAYIPQGTSVTPYYSVDGGTTWKTYENAVVTKKQVDKDYYKYTYKLLLHNQQTGDMTLENQFKGMLDLKTATPVIRPKVRPYSNIVSATDNSENTPFVPSTVSGTTTTTTTTTNK